MIQLFYGLLFVCNVQLTQCQVIRHPAEPFKSGAECHAAVAALATDIVAEIPAGYGYNVMLHCGPRIPAPSKVES